MRVDCVVVGGGSAGAACAYFLARRGVQVTLVEARERDKAGAHWLNGVEKRLYREVGLPDPPDDVTYHDAGRRIMVAGERGRVENDHPPLNETDMRALIRWLYGLAEDAGATLRFASRATIGPWHDRAREVRVGDDALEAPVVVDARGFSGAELALDGALDVCSAYQAVYEVTDPVAAKAWIASQDACPGETHSRTGVQGGFSLLNVALDEAVTEVAILTGTMRAPGFKSGEAMARDFVAETPWIGKRRFGGGGLIPLRPLRDSLVDDGIAYIGDIAGQVFPPHGSGVASGIRAAAIASEVIARALRQGDTRRAALWDYNVRYHRGRGAVEAFYLPMRYVTSGMTPEQQGVSFSTGLINPESVHDVLNIQLPSTRTLPHYDQLRALWPIRQVVPRFGAALALGATLHWHQRRIPTADGAPFERWARHRQRLFRLAARLKAHT